MGLALITGILSDLKSEDVEGYEYFKDQFDGIQGILRQNGIQTDYTEPVDLDKKLIWDCQMYGYGGLHYLRRLAAHIWDGKKNIEPGNEEASEDKVMEKYCDQSMAEESSFNSLLSKMGIKSKKLNFDHLMFHSDAEGFYIPVEFDDVIFDDAIAGGMIGSTYKLKSELEVLIDWLGLDLTIDTDSEEFWALPEEQNRNEIKWKNFGVESYSCINLYLACKESIKNKCAITFC